jgi:hypothetical protein
MDLRQEFVRRHGDDCKGALPFPARRLFPIFPNAGNSEGRAVPHCDRKRLLCLDPLDRRPPPGKGAGKTDGN